MNGCRPCAGWQRLPCRVCGRGRQTQSQPLADSVGVFLARGMTHTVETEAVEPTQILGSLESLPGRGISYWQCWKIGPGKDFIRGRTWAWAGHFSPGSMGMGRGETGMCRACEQCPSCWSLAWGQQEDRITCRLCVTLGAIPRTVDFYPL